MNYLRKTKEIWVIKPVLIIGLVGGLLFAESVRFLDTFDDSDFMIDDLGMADFLDTDVSSGFSLLRSNPTDILTALNAVNAIPLLEQPFYLRSNPTHRRDIIDYPLFESHFSFYPDDVTVGVELFFNKTNKIKFFKNERHITSYLAIGKPDFIDALEDTVANVKLLFQDPAFNLNVEELFALFRNVFMDERRLGGMFYFQRRWERLNIFFMLPFYYRERNFELTPREKKKIEKEFETNDPKFINKHLIADKLGIGDTRIELGAVLYKTKKSQFNLGFQATVPTAIAFKKGLLGNYFPKKSSQPTFDIKKLFDLADDGVQPGESAEAFNTIKTFMTGALDRLSANLLDVPLGNDGHFGVGIFTRTHMPLSTFIKRDWADSIIWDWRASIEYLAGKESKRMFVKFPDPLEFAQRNFETTDEVLAYEYLNFLDQQLVNQFYPPFLETSVQPGFILRSANSLSSLRSWFGWKVGLDFWLQTRESFGINNIDASSYTLHALKIPTAKQDYGYQWKLFGSVLFRAERPDRDWIFSVDVDMTMADYGIGKDWMVGFSIESHF